MPSLADVVTALSEAGIKIRTAAREIARRDDRMPWMHRVIYAELAPRAKTRGAAHWDALFPGLPPEDRAEQRIRRMLVRATVAGVGAAGGATAAELVTIATDGAAGPVAVPLGLVAVGAELLYTTALQVDLAFDLASIYGVPFEGNDVGEIATMLAMGHGVELVGEPSRHDKPAEPGETKRWRVLRQMRRSDFASELGSTLLQHSVLRNAVPIAGIAISAVWNVVTLRRFARAAHIATRERAALVRACRAVHLGTPETARRILDGAWLLATADGDVGHSEALALATLIDSLALPERIAVRVASFSDDEEAWFAGLAELPPAARDVLLEVLILVAAAGGRGTTPERRFLRRVGKVLGREVDTSAIAKVFDRMRADDGAAAPGAAYAPVVTA